MPLGIPFPLQGLGTALKGTLRIFAEASPEFRNRPKISAASDKVLNTLA